MEEMGPIRQISKKKKKSFQIARFLERRIMETQKNISLHKKYNLQKNPPKKKKNQNSSRYYYYNSIITNLKFQTQAKNIIFQKSSYKKKKT